MLTEKNANITSTDETKKTNAVVRIQSWNDTDRKKRAFKYGGITFIAAVVSVAIPLAHFVLVPSLLLATPFVALYFLNQKSYVLDGSGTCPECGAVFTVARAPEVFPFDDLCTNCRKTVKVTLSL